MKIRDYILLILKGAAMGAANVIPGVSGGTIALITGIFERLINAIKTLNLKAIKLLLSGKIKDFIDYTDLYFLLAIFFGIATAIISIAKLFEFLFIEYPTYIWAFFFGLVLSSVFFLGKEISKWNIFTILLFLFGSIVAISISVLSPANENSSIVYLLICGVLAACSMILPGLSGSFVLILMGNYQLIMIDAVSNFRLDILIPVVIGAGGGIIGFSYLLSWVFKKFRNQTMALLTGFVLGSLGILWPWKEQKFEIFGNKEKLIGYDWILPEMNSEFFVALLIFIIGVISIWLIEKLAHNYKKE